MIKATFGITKEPFCRNQPELLPQQTQALEMIKIHAQHGGFCVIIGAPGLGKSVLREHIEAMGKARDTVVVSFTQTLHTYLHILRQLAHAMQLEVMLKDIEKELIQAAFRHAQAQRTLYIVIDEAHLLDTTVLRKLRMLFERFPKRYTLILLGQQELLVRLSMLNNEDIKNRISYSKQLLPLSDTGVQCFIIDELKAAGLGINTFDDAALQIIIRSVQGNLRSCANLCHASLIETCLANERMCTVTHVNAALVQPHWRSHEALIKQQVRASG